MRFKCMLLFILSYVHNNIVMVGGGTFGSIFTFQICLLTFVFYCIHPENSLWQQIRASRQE
jgi:hypothetical protein